MMKRWLSVVLCCLFFSTTITAQEKPLRILKLEPTPLFPARRTVAADRQAAIAQQFDAHAALSGHGTT